MKPIWFRTYTAEELQGTGRDTMVEALGIRVTQVGPDYLCGTMPVDHRTHQVMGILHGGASVVLAETLGSLAGNCVLDETQAYCVGQEINANHLRTVREGLVTGRATPVHLGRRSQVWQIDISDERGRLVCVSRLTTAVVAGALTLK